MSGDAFDERLFFEHDLATPLSNLQGAHYLLRASLPDPGPEVEEALEILRGNAKALEKMLYWYWETRRLDESWPAAPAWSAAALAGELGALVAAHGLPVAPPVAEGALDAVVLAVPRPELGVALLGAAVTLRWASGVVPRWTLSAQAGTLRAEYSVEVPEEALDPGRLLRKLWWPARPPVEAALDPGLPYLRVLLERGGGGCELVRRQGAWRLEAWLPGAPG